MVLAAPARAEVRLIDVATGAMTGPVHDQSLLGSTQAGLFVTDGSRVWLDYAKVDDRYVEAGDTIVREAVAEEIDRWLHAAGWERIEAFDRDHVLRSSAVSWPAYGPRPVRFAAPAREPNASASSIS